MATKPLPTIATDQQGRPVKQDTFEVLFKNNAIMIDIQKIQLDVLTDILGVMKAIGLNIVQAMKKLGMVTVRAEKPIEAARLETKNKLAEAEKEREAKLGSGESKPESLLDSLKKLFEDYFGIFRTVFNVLKLILLPLIFGFIAGFREKFDLFTVALGIAIMYPIRTFKLIFNLMVRVFGFLLETLKSIGKLISKIGPVAKGFVEGITNFFRRMRIFFLRTLDLGKILQPIRALFSGGAGIFKIITPLFKVLKFVLGRLLTPILAIIGGIKGAIEGFQKEGVIGAIKGAIAGALDMAFDWIFDLIGWVFGKLGFEDAEKALEKYGLGETISFLLDSVQEFIVKLFEPIFDFFTGKINFFRGLGRIVTIILDYAKDILAAIIGTLSSLFGSDALFNFAEMLKEFSLYDLFEQAWEYIKDWILGAPKRLLGIGEDETPDVTAAQERLKKAGVGEAADAIEGASVEEAKKLLMEKHGFTEKGADQLLGISTPTPTPKPTPVPSPNKAEEIEKRLAEADKAKQPAQQPPTQNNQASYFDLKQYYRSSVPGPAPVADGMRLGSGGTAAVPNPWNRPG